MELTDLEQRTKAYAAQCFDLRIAVLQQWAGDLLSRLVSNERAWLEFPPKDMPTLALEMAVKLLSELDQHIDANRLDWREYYAKRYRYINTDWDASQFSGDTWLKKALEKDEQA